MPENKKRDYYEVLGLSKGCGDDEMKKAYRKYAKQYHPDLNPGDKEAEGKFKEVNEAYEVLSDSQKRSRYDQFGHAGVDPNFGAGGGPGAGGYAGGFDFGDIGDIFDSFFGGGGFGFGGATRTRDPNAPIRGNNVDINLILSFMESAKGAKKEITVPRLQQCETCSGSGAKAGYTPETCTECGGAGQVRVSQRTPLGQIQTVKPCQKCSGKGKIITQPCPTCKGLGRVRQQKKLEVSVPAGINDGQTFVLRSQGDSGLNGGPAGDVNITVTVRPDPIFERDGFDVWCEIPVTFAQAALGDEITVPTIDGKVSYAVPDGTQPGTVFRLRNRGVPYVGGRGRGDQYVRVNVEVPKNLSQKQKDALKDFDALGTDKNYEKRRGFFDKLKNIIDPK